MPMQTGTVTVNAAFLQELKEDNEQLRGLMAEFSALCVPRPYLRISRSRLASLLARLRDELPMHFSLEDVYGYFERPAAVTPQLSERACRLRAQHAKLYEDLARIADAAEEAWSRWKPQSGDEDEEDQVKKRIVRRCRVFWNQLQQHEASENQLMWAVERCADPVAAPARQAVHG